MDDVVRLDFLRDVSNYIIGKAVGVGGFFVVRGLVQAVSGPELVLVVVGEALLAGAAVLAACGNGGCVVRGVDVPYQVIVVGDVLDDALFAVFHGVEARQPPFYRCSHRSYGRRFRIQCAFSGRTRHR